MNDSLSLSSDLLKTMSETRSFEVSHLPVVASFCKAIKLQEIIDSHIPTRMNLKPGTAVQAMVLDTLTGRSPLYHLEDFMENQDIELLLGENLTSHDFSDTNLGRVLDLIFEAGASNLLTEIALSACEVFHIDCSCVRWDSTAINVWGTYAAYDSDQENPSSNHPVPPKITYGHSKDHRPDLKQVMVELLCVERGVPLFGGSQDGNSSDKKGNNKMLTRLSGLMARKGLGKGAFTYVADSAMVTKDNLKQLDFTPFITRLPMNYSECEKVIAAAVDGDNWENLGCLSELPSPASRPSAKYRSCESQVELYGKKYRTVVIHSDSHDRRMQKRLEKKKQASRKLIEKKIKQHETVYFCRKDAAKAAEELRKYSDSLHNIAVKVEEIQVRKQGRPSKDGSCATRSKYFIQSEIQENKAGIEREEKISGCFVLLTNIPLDGENGMTGKELLRTYKGQYGVESSFAFVKDPLIMNDIFLKKAERIDVLIMVLLLSLLIWRLMERSMRIYLDKTDTTISGLNKKQTNRPTAYAMTTKFRGIRILHFHENRILEKIKRPEVYDYLKALGVTEKVFTQPGFSCIPIHKS